MTTGARYRLAPHAFWVDRTSLAGGDPFRVLRLSPRGVAVVRALLAGQPPSAGAAEAALVARLVGAGLLLAPPDGEAEPPPPDDVTLVIPARSEPAPVRALLAAVPPAVPVVLVDDGSPEPLGPHVPGRESVRVIRHERSRGPAAARNAGAALARRAFPGTRWLAFADADLEPGASWLARLRARAEDADVVAVAPRVVTGTGTGVAAAFERLAPALDQGAAPSEVGPGRLVSYVPTAALLARADAFDAVGGFAEQLVVGEDVDLVWRLGERGRVRYEPDVVVAHAPRPSLAAVLRRRWAYGTSAAALEARHPGTLRHADVSVWSFVPWLLALTVHPVAGLAAAAASAAAAPYGPGLRELPAAQARRLAAHGHVRAAVALGRWLVRPLAPATLLVAAAAPRRRGRLALLVLPGLADAAVTAYRTAEGTGWRRVVTAVATLAAGTADDLAYAGGVWHGVLRGRTPGPLLPRVRDLPRDLLRVLLGRRKGGEQVGGEEASRRTDGGTTGGT